MATATGYGIASGLSKTTTYTVQYAQKEDETGAITNLETYGGLKEETEEDYTSGTLTNLAVNGQSGTTGAGVVTEHTETEQNNDFARVTKKTVTPLATGS